MAEATESKKNGVRFPTILAYASPAIPISAMGLPLVVHLPTFYIDLGLSIAAVGFVFLIARFWDLITDPLMGFCADKFHTRWGRRRIWIAIATPILLVSTFFVFLPQGAVSANYLLFWLVILYVGWTMMTISHLAWGAELSPDYNKRSTIQAAREAFLVAGMIMVLSLPIVIDQFIDPGNLRAGVGSMGWFIIILLPLTVFIALSRAPERITTPTPSLPWTQIFTILKKNPPLQRLLSADIAIGFSVGVVATLFFFLSEDVLKLTRAQANILLLIYFLSGIIFVRFFVYLSHRPEIGKHRTLALSSLITVLTIPCLFIVPESSFFIAVLCWGLLGTNMAVLPFLIRSMTADLADHDAVITGQSHRTGIFFALLTMTNKIGHTLGLWVSLFLVSQIGFVRRGDNAPEVLDQLRHVYVWFPLILNIFIILLMWNYPLDRKRQEENRRILEERLAGEHLGV